MRKYIINDGKVFDGTMKQFKDCFFDNATEESIKHWCKEQDFTLRIENPNISRKLNMKKLTTKIIGDILMDELDKHNKKLKKLNEDFHKRTEFLIKVSGLITKYPNLQISNNLKTMWTSEINHLVSNVYFMYDIYFPHGPIYAYPYALIDDVCIMAQKKESKFGGFDPFYIANKHGADFEGGIKEVEGWRKAMKNEKIPKTIIDKIEQQLYMLVKKKKKR